MRIFHIATAADWAQARRTGRYTTSTRGRTLEEEGFVHACRADQWRAVHTRFYADVAEPLVLLEIDTDRLAAPVVEEPAPEGDPAAGETFPHVLGPVETTAVLRAVPLEQALAGTSFGALFLREVLRNALVGLGLLGLAAAGGVLVGGPDGGPETLLGAGGGFLLGVLALVSRSRRRRHPRGRPAART